MTNSDTVCNKSCHLHLSYAGVHTGTVPTLPFCLLCY